MSEILAEDLRKNITNMLEGKVANTETFKELGEMLINWFAKNGEEISPTVPARDIDVDISMANSAIPIVDITVWPYGKPIK